MDVLGLAASATGALPWLVLGGVVGIALVVLTGLGTAHLLRRRPTAVRPESAPPATDVDDLPGFLESPPGSAAAAPPAGWAALAPGPGPGSRDESRPAADRSRRDRVLVRAATAAAVLLLLGVAAAVAATSTSGPPDRTPPAPARGGPGGEQARLTFGGVVLELRAVGVTATYPVIELSGHGEAARARVELPTFNCLTAEAPADPVAAGCTRSVTEYAELSAPELVVRADGDTLRLSGRFATEVHPNGSGPSATGRAYELRITVTPTGAAGRDGWRPARGVLDLGPGRTATVDDPGLNVLRSSS